MSPAKPISNIHAIATLLLICSALTIACERAETRTAPVTTSTPAGASTAPSSAAAQSRDEALVRVVHAIPFGSSMDVYAGDLLAFNGVGFKSVSSYRALDGKRYAFSLRPAGMTNAKPLATNTEGLEDGRYYSVFALPGEGRSAVLRVVGDHLDRPAEGKSRLRIVHAGAGLGNIDIHASGGGAALLTGVKFRDVTGYQDVDAFNGAIEVRSGDKPVLMLPNAHLETGRFYTMVIVGTSGGSPPLEAFIIEDQLSGR
jgi:uncharacterized protein DUF4397